MRILHTSDCLFVDEGFGSLDSDALDLAIDTLAELRAGGRIGGTTSHAEGVEQRLDLGLHVVKTDRGSRVVTRDARFGVSPRLLVRWGT